MNTLTLQNLQFQYLYGQTAIQNMNLTCDKGEIKCILGGVESGKSSLFKCIAGLYPPTQGSIYINDIRINETNIKHRDICLIHQDGAFFPYRTLEYNLNYPLMIRKVDRVIAMEQILEAATLFTIKDYLSVRMRRLPFEIKLKAMLARAYIRGADLILIDDPLKNAEVGDRERLFELMMGYFTVLKEKSAILYATTNAGECERLGVETAVLHYGIQLQTAKGEELRKYPASLIVYELFFPDLEKKEVILEEKEGNPFISLQGENIYLEREKLLNEIFIGKKLIAAFYQEGERVILPTLRLFDEKSERLIYFPNPIRFV